MVQIYALPNMELVFDHSPIAEGLSTLTGDPEAEPEPEDDSADASGQGIEDSEGFSARPVVVETRMECFAHSTEQLVNDENRFATGDPHTESRCRSEGRVKMPDPLNLNVDELSACISFQGIFPCLNRGKRQHQYTWDVAYLILATWLMSRLR